MKFNPFNKNKPSRKELERQVTQNNELYRTILQYFSGEGLLLDRDMNTNDYIQKGFEGNADIFSIAMKIAGKFAMLPEKLQIKKAGEWEDVDDHEFLNVIKKPNHYQTWFEFKMSWILFRLITGNSIVYTPKIQGGNNSGRLTDDGMLMMPTQYVEIRSGGWRNPIGEYTFTINEAAKGIDPKDVWHERFPSLEYEQGRNFMGLSPLKAAMKMVILQNGGYDRASKMYNQGGPPFLLTDPAINTMPTKEQKSEFERTWKRKYDENRNVNVPALMGDGVKVTKLGYESVKDLGILENVQDGRRVFCNVMQVAAELFNDNVGSTFNNRAEARKEMWTDRVMVDAKAFYEGITNDILPGYASGQIMRLVPDYSEIDELQEDKGKKSEWISKAYQDGVIAGNEYREMLGIDQGEAEHLDQYFMAMNRIPAGLAMQEDSPEPTEAEKEFYRKYNIKY